jgi:broad specificity phosphatase PhoE
VVIVACSNVVLLVRRGETDDNAVDRLRDRRDTGLDDRRRPRAAASSA